MSWIENCGVLDILQVPEKQEHTMKMVDHWPLHSYKNIPELAKSWQKGSQEYNLQGMLQF